MPTRSDVINHFTSTRVDNAYKTGLGLHKSQNSSTCSEIYDKLQSVQPMLPGNALLGQYDIAIVEEVASKQDDLAVGRTNLELFRQSCAELTPAEEQQMREAGSTAYERGREGLAPDGTELENECEDAFENSLIPLGHLFDDPPVSPLILDLDGTSNVELTALENSTAFFDIDGDGFAEHVGWTAANGDGFLAIDRNSDGQINDITELFGNETTDGFVELAELDRARDGADRASARHQDL